MAMDSAKANENDDNENDQTDIESILGQRSQGPSLTPQPFLGLPKPHSPAPAISNRNNNRNTNQNTTSNIQRHSTRLPQQRSRPIEEQKTMRMNSNATSGIVYS